MYNEKSKSSTLNLHDLGLIKLMRSIEESNHKDLFGANNICLPEKTDRYDPDINEYARVAGWSDDILRSAYFRVVTDNKTGQVSLFLTLLIYMISIVTIYLFIELGDDKIVFLQNQINLSQLIASRKDLVLQKFL